MILTGDGWGKKQEQSMAYCFQDVVDYYLTNTILPGRQVLTPAVGESPMQPIFLYQDAPFPACAEAICTSEVHSPG